MKIALVTYDDKGIYAAEGTTEDKLLHQYLVNKGLKANICIWTDTRVKWQQYDYIILKSTWDYFDKIQLFWQWLDLLDSYNIKVLNPPVTIRWNINKAYLLEIAQAGFAIVPTTLLPTKSYFEAASYFKTWNTEKIIVKPAISGGAKNTYSFSQTQAADLEANINRLLTEEDYLLQPFIPEIQTEGEWSLLFFNNKFSHAVRKIPKMGDFRVQHYFGGAILPETPPPAVLEYAQNLVNQFAPGCLYARVDGLETANEFKLMELELIEPLLYLFKEEKLFENYYQALMQLTQG